MLALDLPHYRDRNRTILSEISLRLDAGSDLTLMGPNGVGKSTLARILCGLIPTRGAVRIDEKPLEAIPPQPRSRLIDYIPPRLEIYDDFLSVEGYLKLCGEACGIEEALRLFGLGTFAKRRVIALSSGEQQLLMLACARRHAARYTIYDEPTANLDPSRTKKIFDYLKRAAHGKIVITHDLQLAYRLGFPIYYLHEGRGRYYPDAGAFFSEENLHDLFGDSLLKRGDIVVVNL